MTKKQKILGIVYDALVALICALIAFVCIYPFYYVFIYSISDANAASSANLVFLPVSFSLETYKGIFQFNDIPSAFFISVSRSVLGTIITIACTSFFAFLLTRRKMIGRKIIYRMVVVTMYINAGLIPWYLVMKAYGLKDNFLLYIVPGAVVAYYLILIKTYFEQLPQELEESAMIDGAGYITIFSKIVFPLSKPIIATIGVYSIVSQWNTWSDNYFLVTDSKLQTLQMVLYNYLNQANRMQNMASLSIDASAAASSITPASVKMCITMIVILPVLFVYPFLQRYFVKGIMIGAVKG